MLTVEDRNGVDTIRNALVDAILRGDADSYAECFTSDGVVMHPDSPHVRGRNALRQYVNQMFSVVKVTKLVLTPVIVGGGNGFAYEVGVQEVAIEPPDVRFKAQRQHLHVYERQQDGTWLVAAAMSGNQ